MIPIFFARAFFTMIYYNFIKRILNPIMGCTLGPSRGRNKGALRPFVCSGVSVDF
jgi:hypothetical protein